MAIYQFLIAVRSASQGGGASFQLTNADGETTSHIQGMFNRTIRYMTEGIKPVFVFDGKPPDFKSGELLKRREKRAKAQKALANATEEGDVAEQDKQSKRLVRAGTKENEDCQKLLRLMGVPVVLSPCEAEAQCAALAESGLVYASGTEDMDALTFRTPVLVRKMTFASGSKSLIQTINYKKALEGLGLTADQVRLFVRSREQ
jgi:flap endonuclease-1